MYVAVVIAPGRESHASSGGWQSFVGDSQRQVVEQALRAVSRWGPTKYEVYVGTLTAKAKAPVNYRLVKL